MPRTTRHVVAAFDVRWPNGHGEAGRRDYEVSNGQVSLNGQVIGEVNDAGDYSVTFNGQQVKGNVGDLIGASISGTLSDGSVVDNRPTGEVQVGTEHYSVVDGDVMKGGAKVGTINDRGDFALEGTDGGLVTGNIDQVTGASYEGELSNGKKVDNQPTGLVQLGEQTYKVLNGVVLSKDGKDVLGSIDDRGNYNVGGATGNIGDLDGAVYSGRLSNGQKVDNRINGEVQFNGSNYQIFNGQVFKGGAKVGTVDAEGGYRVTENGHTATGHVQDLVGAHWQAAMPGGRHIQSNASGQVHFGDTDYVVRNGEVFLGDKDVGTLGNDGRFDVTLDGRRYQGMLTDLPGVSYDGYRNDGSQASNIVSGSVTVGGRTYEVRDGEVFDGRTRIGSVNSSGDFAVRLNGKVETGNVTKLPGAKWKVTG